MVSTMSLLVVVDDAAGSLFKIPPGRKLGSREFVVWMSERMLAIPG